MTSFIESQKPKVFTGSKAECVQKILELPGHFAFLMESNYIDCQIVRNCELTQIGGLLESKGYGITFTLGKRNVVEHNLIHASINRKKCKVGIKALSIKF